MDWIERLNGAMKYIEEHLTDTISMEEASRIACCSSYHFQRMFAYMAGVPLSEYIRRRRMSLAAGDLLDGERVVDVALKYGYSSPTAFNRAFQSVHGMAPSMAGADGALLKTYLPISFKITIKGVDEMNYRIEKKEAFRIMGVAVPMYKEVERNFEIIPGVWQKAAQDGTIPKLAEHMNGSCKGILGVSACGSKEEWKYMIATATEDPLEEGWEEYEIPATTWAVFEGAGQCPGAIQELEKRIVTEWLPASGYEYGDGPDVELYLSPDPQKAQFEVWIPVVKK